MDYELKYDVFWRTNKYIPFLGFEIGVKFISEDHEDQPPTPRQMALLDSIDKLTENFKPKIDDWAKKDFKQRLAKWRMPRETLEKSIGITIDEQNIQNHYHIHQVTIPRIEICVHNYIFLSGECDWDMEHGIEFLLKNGDPIRCSAQQGLSLSGKWNQYLAQK